jgi:hypothetical protein
LKDPLELASEAASEGQTICALNAASGWGLIPKRIGAAERRLVVIDSTRGGVYSGVNPDERPALTARQTLARIARVVDVLDPMATCAAWLDMEPDQSRLDIRIEGPREKREL